MNAERPNPDDVQPFRQELEPSAQRYRRLIEAVTDYMFTVRVENGRPIETIHGANCLAVTGYSPEEFARIRAAAETLGFRHVEAGPLVRSSYHADEAGEKTTA